MYKSGLPYRIQQKLIYHFSNDPVQKSIAELNRYEKVITVKNDTFSVKGSSLIFNLKKHYFVIQNLEIFLNLLLNEQIEFEIIEDQLTCHINNLAFSISTAEEIYIINEIWIEGSYNIELNSTKKYVVMDVGMNVGLATLFFCSKDFIKKVYSYEPFKPTFEIAEKNIDQNPNTKAKIQTHNYGLSSKNEELEVNYSLDNRGRTGIWGTELILDKIDKEQKEKIVLKNFNDELSRVIQENPEIEIILKIDCEGSEYGIFETLKEDLLNHVKCILLEWHKKGPNLITQKLRKNDFSIISFNSNSNKVGMLYAFK